MRILCIAAAVVTLARSVAAQDTGPRKGSWGAEAGFGTGVSLLHFRSDRSAWIVGVNGAYNKHAVEVDGVPDEEDTSISAQLRLGLRSYGRAGQALRPFHTVAGLVSVIGGSRIPRLGYGLVGESGGAYFFSPQLSLGAGASVIALRSSYHENFGGPDYLVTSTSITVQLFFAGAVYF